MAMNRETKRMMQRQGQLTAEGAPVRQARQPRQPGQRAERTPPRQFLREVNQELRKVAWPTKSEVVNYSIIVLLTVVLLTAFISSLDWVVGNLILDLFDA